MKTNLKKEFTRWGLLILLGAILIGFTQCVGTKTSSTVKTDDYHGSVEQVPSEILEEARPDIIEEAPEVAVKDYERIFHTMSAVTGVPMTGNPLTEYNNRIRAQMPANSRLETLSETNILGIAKMASEFCDVLFIDNGTSIGYRNAIWPSATFNFGQNSNTFWAPNSNSRTMFIDVLLNQFWGEGVLEPLEYQEGRAAINELIDAMLTAQVVPGATPGSTMNVAAPANNATTTRNVAKAACTVALSSVQVYFQ